MANITASNFTTVATWREGDKNGKLKQLVKIIELSSGTAGGTTNLIDVEVLGFKKVYEVQASASDQDFYYHFAPSFAGTEIYAFNLEQATDANRADPADVAFATHNIRLLIRGLELSA